MSEYIKLDDLMRNNIRIREYRIEQIGEVGYVIHLIQRSVIGTKLVLFDLDDTLIASWAAMDKRIDNFIAYCHAQDIMATNEELDEVFKLADKYARWPEHTKPVYHFQHHVQALAHAVVQMKQSRTSPLSLDSQLEALEKDAYMSDDLRVIFDDLMERVFNAVIQPDTFEETTEAAATLASAGNNIGIFTYGEPLFQLQKTLALLDGQPSMPVSQIWLTKASKGDFMLEVIGANILPDIAKILVIDDSPIELESILRSTYENRIRVRAVRSLQQGTKTETHVWDHELAKQLTLNALGRQLTPVEIHVHIERILDDTIGIE